MSYAEKFNKKRLFDVTISEDATYVDLKSLFDKNGVDKIYPVQAIYINTKGKFDDAPVIVMDSETLVNCPAHLTEQVKEMLSDDELVKAVNNGEVGFKIYNYVDSKFNKSCYSIEWA